MWACCDCLGLFSTVKYLNKRKKEKPVQSVLVFSTNIGFYKNSAESSYPKLK